MEIKQAVSILENHNEWRRNNEVPNSVPMVEPKELGVAIDVVVDFVKVKLETIKVKRLQDFESDWYWIPEEKIETFNEMNDELSGMVYTDNPDFFEKFNDDFGGFSTGGSPDSVPHNFENKNVEFL